MKDVVSDRTTMTAKLAALGFNVSPSSGAEHTMRFDIQHMGTLIVSLDAQVYPVAWRYSLAVYRMPDRLTGGDRIYRGHRYFHSEAALMAEVLKEINKIRELAHG
jgi:hypothetical protein